MFIRCAHNIIRYAHIICSLSYYIHYLLLIKKQNRIERRPARQIQEYVADSSAADEAADVYRSANVNVGILSEKEGRRLQASTSCAPEDIVDCVEGLSTYVNSRGDNVTVSCEAACEDACCVGTEACLNFTGSLCKDMTSCSGFRACKNAKITSVFNSCNGRRACDEAGLEGYVGNVTNSCNDPRTCNGAARNGGYIGEISSSCNDGNYNCKVSRRLGLRVSLSTKLY